MKSISVIVMLATLGLAGCDNQQSAKSPPLEGVLAKLAGRDLCKVTQEQADDLKYFKDGFIALVGQERWSEWESYSGDCGAIEKVTVPDIGDLVLLRKVELVGNGMANTGRSAVIFSHLNGDIEAICFSDNGSNESPAQSEWVGATWRRTSKADQCGYDVNTSDKLAHLVAAKKAALEEKEDR